MGTHLRALMSVLRMRRGRWGKDKIGEKRVEGELRVLITQRRLLLYIPRFPKSHML